MSERPVLRVVSGNATPEEVAAVVAAVAASSVAVPEAAASTGPRTTSVWAARGYAHRNVRATFAPSTDGWRTSFWPR